MAADNNCRVIHDHSSHGLGERKQTSLSITDSGMEGDAMHVQDKRYIPVQLSIELIGTVLSSRLSPER